MTWWEKDLKAQQGSNLGARKTEAMIDSAKGNAVQSGASARKLNVEADFVPADMQSTIAKRGVDTATAKAQLPYAAAAAEAAARKARADAAIADDQRKFHGLPAQTYVNLRGRASSLRNLKRLATEQKRLYDAYFKDQGLFSAREYVPDFLSPVNQQFNNISDQMLPIVGSVLGKTSRELDNPTEVERLRKYLPQTRSFDQTNEERFRNLNNMTAIEEPKTAATLGERPAGKRPPLSSFFEKK